MENIYNSKEYKRSRKAYVAQCSFEYFISLLVTDAFLAKLLTEIGLSDSTIGIISSMISFAFLFKLLTIWLVKYMKNVKRTVMISDTLSILMFMSIYLIPFLPVGVGVKKVLVVVGIILAYLFKYLIHTVMFKWGNSHVDPHNRGEFSAGKEMTSLITGIIFTLIIGHIIDHYESIGNLDGGFLFTAAAMLILNICNFISLMNIKNDTTENETEHTPSLKEVAKNTFGNKGFVNLVIMSSGLDIAKYMVVGFMGTFKTKDLLISVGMVQVINMVANLLRFVISKPMGRLADKTSYATGYRVGLTFLAIGFAINIFTTKSTWWCVILYTIFYNLSIAGTNQNGSNMLYSYVKSEYMVQAGAIRSSIAGVIGFLSSLVGGRILAYVQAHNNMIFGIHIYGQQLLSGIALFVTIGLIVFIKKVAEKEKVMIQ